MTKLFAEMTQLQSFYDASGSLADLNALEAAESDYARAVRAAAAEWDALPDGEAKESAETNANESEGLDAADRLGWLQVAIRSYHLR